MGSAVIRHLMLADHAPALELWVRSRAAGQLRLVNDNARLGIVGVILATFDGRRGWLHHLAVSPTAGAMALPGDWSTAPGDDRVHVD